jgi:hypothetical protein
MRNPAFSPHQLNPTFASPRRYGNPLQTSQHRALRWPVPIPQPLSHLLGLWQYEQDLPHMPECCRARVHTSPDFFCKWQSAFPAPRPGVLASATCARCRIKLRSLHRGRARGRVSGIPPVVRTAARPRRRPCCFRARSPAARRSRAYLDARVQGRAPV